MENATQKQTEKMTVQRALNELTLLESRINKQISELRITGTKKKSETRVSETREDVETFKSNASASLNSIYALMHRKNVIKEAVMMSNANTIIEVGGYKYTVMAAIERKRSIQANKMLLNKLKNSLSQSEYRIADNNESVEMAIQRQSNAMASSDSNKSKTDLIVAFEKAYREENYWELVEAIDTRKEVFLMEQDIDVFEMEIDTVLTVSNATTIIEIG